MNYILFDDNNYQNLLPLTYTRPVASLRCGILTMNARWEKMLHEKCSFKTQDYLQVKFPLTIADDNIFINGSLFCNSDMIERIQSLVQNECLIHDQMLVAARCAKEEAIHFSIDEVIKNFKTSKLTTDCKFLQNPWDIFSMNDWAIRFDYDLITKGCVSQPLASTNQLIGNNLFIEEGAKISCSILNTETGPIYIGKDAEIMEGSIIRGPFAMGEHAVLKMGAKIYGATTLGDSCKVGGEVNNAVFYANSSKAHDGFVGNAVFGEWCNLGADTNNSNLKNNYEEVKLWSESKQSFVKTGLQFCGLIMADHSKCGINTMFNTGTIIGVSCNIFGSGFPRNFVPSFSWGGAQGYTEYKLAKASETARKVFARRNLTFDEIEQNICKHIFEQTQEQRKY